MNKGTDEEVKAYAIGIGNLPMNSKRAEDVVKKIKATDNLLGVHIIPPRGTLLIYPTENDAKIARNRLTAGGVRVSEKICSCWIDRQFAR